MARGNAAAGSSANGGTEMSPLFEQRALEKHRDLQPKERSLRLLTPPLQATIWLGVALGGAGVAWACLAKVPILVEGTSIVAPVNTLRSLKSLSAGSAIFHFNAEGSAAPGWEADAWQLFHNPDSLSDDKVVSLAQRLSTPLDYTQLPEVSGTNAEKVSAGRVLVQIEAKEEREKLLSALRALQNTQRRVATLNSQQRTKNQILMQEQKSRKGLLESMKKLQTSGYVSDQEILQQQAELDEISSSIYSNNALIEQNNAARQDAIASLREAVLGFIDRTLVFSDVDLYIKEVSVEQRGQVASGEELLIASDRPAQLPFMVPAYLSNKEAAQTFPGMEVIVSPIGVDRSQYGGIRGKVHTVARIPASRDEIVARLGLEGLADLVLEREATPTEIIVELLRNPTPDNTDREESYLWTSGEGPPFPVKVGDQLDIQITTRTVRPIELVVPFLRRITGWTPPVTRIDSEVSS